MFLFTLYILALQIRRACIFIFPISPELRNLSYNSRETVARQLSWFERGGEALVNE